MALPLPPYSTPRGYVAEIEKAGGKSPAAKELAMSIIDTQSSELTQFKRAPQPDGITAR
jgi:hypothetical protein